MESEAFFNKVVSVVNVSHLSYKSHETKSSLRNGFLMKLQVY